MPNIARIRPSLPPILPGATIGVLGSGQLGRMFAIAARRMGYRVHTFSPESDTPTGQVADIEIIGDYEDLDAVGRFAQGVDVVTFEFENVSSASVTAAEAFVPVRPAGSVLYTAQNRLREKTFLSRSGFPVGPFRPIRSQSDFEQAVASIGLPSVLKTAGFGYDGKGQTKIASREDFEKRLKEPFTDELVLEAFIDFELELSVVAARSSSGEFAHWGAIENSHSRHILDVSVAPARVAPSVAVEAVEIARGILDHLDVVGVLCVEFFLTRDGKLLVNELAPRPHNSGHLTFDACVTSQFEQQLRAVCNLPLGSTELVCPAAMANLLGDLWETGEPNWYDACAYPEVKLHLYGKVTPKRGRKMGHLTALATTPERAASRVIEARRALVG